MRKETKKSPTRKGSSSTANRHVAVEPTASQRRILQVIATGTAVEEPDGVLAGASFTLSR